MKWLIDLIDKIKVPFNVKRVTGIDYYRALETLIPGDVILTTTKGWIINTLNPSEYKHGALYVGGGDIKYVIESTTHGVVKTDLVSFLMSKDYFIIVRNEDATLAERNKIINLAYTLIGKAYDFDFVGANDKYYCFELIAFCYKQVMMNPKIRSLKFCGKRRYISQSFKRWKLIMDSEAISGQI